MVLFSFYPLSLTNRSDKIFLLVCLIIAASIFRYFLLIILLAKTPQYERGINFSKILDLFGLE